jgi:hypothetical protein
MTSRKHSSQESVSAPCSLSDPPTFVAGLESSLVHEVLPVATLGELDRLVGDVLFGEVARLDLIVNQWRGRM